MSVQCKITTLIFVLFTVAANAQRLSYTNQTDAGVLIGSASAESFNAQIFNGVRVSQWKLEAGITTGIDIYQQMPLVPLALGLKWNPFGDRNISPLISLNAGYGFAWLGREKDNEEHSGGYIFNPSLGIRMKTKSSARLNLGLGYRQQNAVIRHSHNYYAMNSFWSQPLKQKDEHKFRRLSLQFGISF